MSLSTRCFALVLILALGIATGCIRNPDKEYGGRGDYLAVGAYMPLTLDKILYSEGGQNFVITPEGEDMTLALVRARVSNQKSTQVTLSVDKESAVLRDSDGNTFKALYYRELGVETSEPVPEDNPYTQFIWGPYTVVKGFQVDGWFFFEVPEDSEFAEFIWDDVEYVRVIYRQ